MEKATETDRSNRRPVVASAIAATILMLVFGLAYRVVAARLAAPPDTTPISQEALDQFPMQLDDWTGRDVPMDAAIIRETDTDARINRVYSRRNGMEYVSYYVAGGVRARDLMPHCPEVCYTGSGWTLMERHKLELALADGTTLPCNAFQFSRGALGTEKVVVFYYYIVDGQYCADVSLLRSKAWRGSGAVGYVAQVELVAPVMAASGADSAKRLVSEFAVRSALPTAQLFKSWQEKPQEGRQSERQSL